MPENALPAALGLCTFAELSGWQHDDLETALQAFRRSADAMPTQFAIGSPQPRYSGMWQDWHRICQASHQATNAHTFFEQNFTPCKVIDSARPEGLFTGYYEPVAEGSLTPSAEYPAPIYARPAELVAFDDTIEQSLGFKYGRIAGGRPQAYFTRRQIEQGALAGRGLELLWLKSWVDAFFIQVQGSGRVRLQNGSEVRLTYAAKSGLPYTSIGAVLVERGELRREDLSMQALRGWMASRPSEARELMWQNQSFVFFKILESGSDSENLGALGAQHVNLTPLRSLAVDKALWAYGTPVWLNLMAPTGQNAELEPFRRLMIAQDTGSAIKGAARGDVYWGWGEKAALTAGHMASAGEMIVLLPKSFAARLDFAR